MYYLKSVDSESRCENSLSIIKLKKRKKCVAGVLSTREETLYLISCYGNIFFLKCEFV